MTVPTVIKDVFYYALLTLSCLTSFYLISLNVTEISNRSAGHYTLFSQMSWLTDRQAVIYCSFLTITFISLLSLIGYKLYHSNKKGATLISMLTLIFAIAVLFLETLFYYKPVWPRYRTYGSTQKNKSVFKARRKTKIACKNCSHNFVFCNTSAVYFYSTKLIFLGQYNYSKNHDMGS